MIFSFLRRHLYATAAVFLLVAGSASAVVSSTTKRQAASSERMYACVTAQHKTMNLSSAKAKCPPGQSKVAWNKTGPRGAKGATGQTGAQGAAGPAGNPGVAGTTGAPGTKGDAGASGPAGAQGPQGDAGATGPQGPAGNDGATGPQGPAGSSAPAFMSGGPATLTTAADGLSDAKAYLPLTGQLLAANEDPNAVAQIVPSAVTFTGVRMMARASNSLALIGTTVEVTVRLHTGANTPAAVPGAECSMHLTGVIGVGDKLRCNGGGFSAPLAAGHVAWIEVSAIASGLSLVNSVPVQLSVALFS